MPRYPTQGLMAIPSSCAAIIHVVLNITNTIHELFLLLGKSFKCPPLHLRSTSISRLIWVIQYSSIVRYIIYFNDPCHMEWCLSYEPELIITSTGKNSHLKHWSNGKVQVAGLLVQVGGLLVQVAGLLLLLMEEIQLTSIKKKTHKLMKWHVIFRHSTFEILLRIL